MLDQAHEAIIVRDFQTRQITFWNPGAERLYGWSAAEAVGRNMGDLVFVDQNARDTVDEQLLHAGTWQGEHRHLSKSGKKLIVSSSVTLVREASGQPKSALIINVDITGQKNLEAQFLRAQRMESIGTLASGLAHDLNNILAPIMMSVPILRRDLPADRRDEIIDGVESCAARGAEIVKQVLTFGRGLEGEKQHLKIGPLVEEVTKIIRQTFSRDIVIESSLAPGLWPVNADATQLHQVLLNLCVNARDAMPDGGNLRLRAANLELDENYASTMPEATPGPHVLIQVSDTGTGIPPEVVERMFEPFFTTKGIGKGTGLGLSTVRGIVKNHGGFITVVSKPGKGTNFQVYLPASPKLDDASASAANTEMLEGHGELVLIVDDEEGVRNAARTALETFGYQVLLAIDGVEGLGVFAQNSDRVALLLVDLMMPVMSGRTFIRAVRRIAPNVPVVASTGLVERTQLEELKALGVSTVLNKPYRADTLLRTIHAALHPAPVAGAPA